jgi:hypothetical protein
LQPCLAVLDREASVRNLLDRYLEAHNRAVTTGDTTGLDAVLHEEAVWDVEGPSLSRLRSASIGRMFRGKEIVIWNVGTVGDDVAFASYAWRAHPRIGGHLRVQQDGGRIRRITLRPGRSRIFSLLDGPGTTATRWSAEGPSAASGAAS